MLPSSVLSTMAPYFLEMCVTHAPAFRSLTAVTYLSSEMQAHSIISSRSQLKYHIIKGSFLTT